MGEARQTGEHSMITRRDVKEAAKHLRPEVVRVLRKSMMLSQGKRRSLRAERPILKIKHTVAITPSWSGAHETMTVSLARVDFITRTDKYFTGEKNDA
jgi:hypothetical protein